MDITKLRIKLPYDMMLEEQREKELKKEQEIRKKKETLDQIAPHVLSYLINFKSKIIDFNVFIELYTPYPTISQEYKKTIRDRIRDLKQFYYEFSQEYPYCIFNEYKTREDEISQSIYSKYNEITSLLNTMNAHIQNISEKKVFYSNSSSARSYNWPSTA